MNLTEREIVERFAKIDRGVDDLRGLVDAARALIKPEPEPDYSSWVGGLVEVSRDGKAWVTRELSTFYPTLPSPFITSINSNGNPDQWKFCRHYTKPLKLLFQPHDGGRCPVGEGEWVMVQFKDGSVSKPTLALKLEWEHGKAGFLEITGYMRIEI